MNSLLKNYGSDDDNSNDSDGINKIISRNNYKSESAEKSEKSRDTTYDSVPMDFSEESNNNNSSDDNNDVQFMQQLSTFQTDTAHNISRKRRGKDQEDDTSREQLDEHCGENKYQEISDHTSHSVKKEKVSLLEFKIDEKRLKDAKKELRNCEKDIPSKSEKKMEAELDHRIREKNSKQSKSTDRDRDRGKNKEKDKDRNRNRKKYSRDPSYSDRHKSDKYSRDKGRRYHRSRSRSREKTASYKQFSYRKERQKHKLAQLEKLGIDIRIPEGDPHLNKEQSFYDPLTTSTQGKYAEQIQKRKLLWANKKHDEDKHVGNVTSNTWVGTTFSHDQDGKQTAKFKRLMGIKEDTPVATTTVTPDILKKQEEMFNNMEQQYEVARATTHTQRGVGLGYASNSFPFPR